MPAGGLAVGTPDGNNGRGREEGKDDCRRLEAFLRREGGVGYWWEQRTGGGEG